MVLARLPHADACRAVEEAMVAILLEGEKEAVPAPVPALAEGEADENRR